MKVLKLFISMMLTTMMCFSAAAVSAAAGSSYIRGDADGDGTITVFDATVIQRKLIDLPVAAFYEKAADVDGGGLDITDATKIQRKIAAFPDPYHIGETVSDYTQPTQDEYELPFIPV